MKKIKKNELKIGEIYCQNWNNYYYIFKLDNFYKGKAISNTNNNNNNNYFDNWISQLDHNSNLREATAEEKHWLETCINTNGVITKEEALKTFKSKSEFIDNNTVETSEGSIFIIGDKVKIVNKTTNTVFEITGFRWNNAKTEICAIVPNIPYGIGVDKLELYVETPMPVKEESLLDKAKRLYPVGTKFKVVHLPQYTVEVLNHEKYMYQTKDICNLNIVGSIECCTGASVYYEGKWAEIIEYPHGFKVGDKIKLLRSEQKLQHVITKIEGNELFYNFNNKEFKILAKNAIKT